MSNARPRRAKRIDSNQPALVKFLRNVGVDVYVIEKPVDLLIAWRGRNILLEVKDPSKSPSRRRLTADQIDFFASWTGPVYKVETIEDCMRVLGL